MSSYIVKCLRLGSQVRCGALWWHFKANGRSESRLSSQRRQSSVIRSVVYSALTIGSLPRHKSGTSLTGVLDHIGLSRMAKNMTFAKNAHAICPTPALDAMRRYGLFDKPDRTSFDDGVSGERAGAKFSMIETHLQEYRGSGKHRRLATAFRGVLIHIEYPRDMSIIA